MTSTTDTTTNNGPGSPVQWLRQPRLALLQLKPFLTRAGGALLFDAAVFLALGVMAASLLGPDYRPSNDGGTYMALGLIAFALFWCSICDADLSRFRKLHRRWMVAARNMPPRQAAPTPAPVDSRVMLWKPSVAPFEPATLSCYRPARPARRQPSLLLLKARVPTGS